MTQAEYGGLIGMLQGMEAPDEVETVDIHSPEFLERYYASIMPGPGEAYYMVGRRPLDIESLESWPNGKSSINHYQLIRNDGRNFGFRNGGIFSERPEKLAAYQYDTSQYGSMPFKAALIEEAAGSFDPGAYNMLFNNCQDYTRAITDAVLKKHGLRWLR